jgi:hypothetical protein
MEPRALPADSRKTIHRPMEVKVNKHAGNHCSTLYIETLNCYKDKIGNATLMTSTWSSAPAYSTVTLFLLPVLHYTLLSKVNSPASNMQKLLQ